MKRFEKRQKSVGPRSGHVFALCAVGLCAVLLMFAPSRVLAQSAEGSPKADKPAADKSSSGNAQNGKALFTSDGCYECHGRAAQGGAGPRLGPHPIALAQILTYVRQPAGEMPPYTSKVISDAELTDIYAFLQSLPEPPKVESIPLLK